jgi:uncharacterized protein
MSEGSIQVEVVYAQTDRQWVLNVLGETGLTLQDAVVKSGILKRCLEIDWSTVDAGVFGKVTRKDTLLNDGDRVEIYRPLIADPKEMRKKRAAEGKVMRRGGGDVSAEGES